MSLSPASPCGTCAFAAKGSGGAADESKNALKGQLCALGGMPFFCHHAPDGRELVWGKGEVAFWDSLRGRGDLRVCAGWKREVAQHARRGLFRVAWHRLIRRSVAESAMEALAELPGRTGKRRKAVLAYLGRAVKFLAARDIGPLLIPMRRKVK